MPDTYPSDELQDRDRPIIEQLERMYGTQAEDAQSLARIRARIVQNSKGPLPFPQFASSSEQSHARSQKRSAKENNMSFMRVVTTREKPWQRQLNLIAAAIFVVLLVGSLILVVARRPQTPIAGPHPLQAGWMQAALFNGDSSKTFTHQAIALSTLWGVSFGCIGQGKVDIELDGQKNNTLTATCQHITGPLLSAPYGPDTITLATSAHTIQTVKVTVSGTLNWYLQFSNAQIAPTPLLSTLLAPGSGWQEQQGMSTRGNASSNFTSSSVVLPNGKTIHPKIWGVVVVCSGPGTIHIQLDPAVKGIQIAPPVCNQQPVLDVLRFSSPPTFEEIRVIAGIPINDSVVWQLHILACTDEQVCLKNQ